MYRTALFRLLYRYVYIYKCIQLKYTGKCIIISHTPRKLYLNIRQCIMREPLLVCGRAYLVYTARCLNIFGYYINSILTHVALDTYFLLSLATKRKCTCTQ